MPANSRWDLIRRLRVNQEGNQLIQEYRHQNSIQNHQHDTATTDAKNKRQKPKWDL